MKRNLSITAISSVLFAVFSTSPVLAESLRVATFNVSMDATNYTAKNEQVKSDALVNALRSNHQ
ncbi:MAG: endonuclease/exonuclease/phosphatase family protein, partial [Pseudoalteromonas sp.]|nr:endonuclease/exonuclease/phosphatase family protein [Pseudoalteromonas sp.]